MDAQDDERAWDEWCTTAAKAVGVEPAWIDVARIHALSRVVAHDFERPLAPVSTYILGLAVGQGGGELDVEDLTRRLLATIGPSAGTGAPVS